MRFLSVCSGIEAASVAWQSLGWQAVAFSEIEPFPCAVLAHHYPDVPNYGDMTRFEEWPDADFDVLVGGTPCQSFSVAGLRKGLVDHRGNLTLTFLGVVDRYKPRFVVWENVPGVISDKTGALVSFLDGLEELGYVVDIDILDAQFFGLAQRRRRVFVCGQRVDDLMQQRTNSSALTISQVLAECSLLALGVLSDRWNQDSETCGFDVSSPVHSLMRRMRLFGLLEPEAASILLPSLAVLQRSCAAAQSGSASDRGKAGTAGTATSATTRSRASTVTILGDTAACQSTATSLNSTLADALSVMNECITSTVASETTESKIYSCARLTLCIAAHITPSLRSCPTYWSAASSVLTALEAFTNYARSAGSDLFTPVEWVQPWRDFLAQAVRHGDAIRSVGAGENFGSLLSFSESLRGDSAPSREAGKDVASGSADRAAFGGNNTGGPIDVATALNACASASGRMDFESETFVAHTLRGESFDASEDGTGRGTPIVPVIGFQSNAGSQGGDVHVECAPTLRVQRTGGGGMPAIAFDTTQITSSTNRSNPKPGDPCHTLAAGAHPPAIAFAHQAGGTQTTLGYDPELGTAPTLAKCQTPAVHHGMAVRRLTATECEFLQGFPRNYTRIAWRGRSPEQCPDGPRYRALGNSFAVPVVAWIGSRIAAVHALALDAGKVAA